MPKEYLTNILLDLKSKRNRIENILISYEIDRILADELLFKLNEYNSNKAILNIKFDKIFSNENIKIDEKLLNNSEFIEN